MNTRRLYWQILAALVVLILGVLVYVLDRDPQRVYFLTGFLSKPVTDTMVFSTLGASLPSFAHVYAFILLTATLLPSTRQAMLSVCLFWLVVDSAFEIGQHSTIAPLIATAVPEWFSRIPLLENTAPYFLYSTFDLFDLIAIVTGALAAGITLHVTVKDSTSVNYSNAAHDAQHT